VIFAVISGAPTSCPATCQPVPSVGVHRDPRHRHVERDRAGPDRPLGRIHRGSLRGILAIMNVWKGMSPCLIVITLVAGLVMGLWNGWWTAYRNVPAFIVTMAGLLVFRGILVGITDGITIGRSAPSSVSSQEFLPRSPGLSLGHRDRDFPGLAVSQRAAKQSTPEGPTPR